MVVLNSSAEMVLKSVGYSRYFILQSRNIKGVGVYRRLSIHMQYLVSLKKALMITL